MCSLEPFATTNSWRTFPRVVNGTAPADYLEPKPFFAKSYPTRGMKELLKAVCPRLSGKGGEVSSIIRLGTQYGGGIRAESSRRCGPC